MPGFKLALTLAAAAYAIVKIVFGKKDDDDPPPPPPPRDSSYSYNSGTWNQTQQTYRPPQQTYKPPPPPPPSYSYRTPATNAHRQTTNRTPAPPDLSHGVYYPSVAKARTPSQAQPSSTRAQASRPYCSHCQRVHEPPEYEYFDTGSYVPSQVYTRSEPRLPTAPSVVSSDPSFDEPAIVEDLEFAKKLRERARRQGRKMSEARSQAKSARKKRYGGSAQAHNREASVHEKVMKELDKRAAKIIFTENNKNRKEEGKIDLHGLYVAEAVQFAKDQVQIATLRGDEVVRFIVGKGLHSEVGPKIRPALEAHFTKRGLQHSLDPYNAGVLIVRLD